MNAGGGSNHGHGGLFGCEGVSVSGGFLQNLVSRENSGSGEMLLLEKQGLSSQQQRMQEAAIDPVEKSPTATSNSQNNAKGDSSASTGSTASLRHRSGSLPPSSLPRPPRISHHRSGVPLPRRLGEYNRLENGDVVLKKPQQDTRLGNYNRLDDNVGPAGTPPRKKSDGAESTSSAGSASKRPSLIPPAPRKLGEYNRLAESDSRSSLRKPSSLRGSGNISTGTNSERNSASTLSDNSASSLPPPSKLRLFGAHTRRGSSLGRETTKSAQDGSSKYRIQF